MTTAIQRAALAQSAIMWAMGHGRFRFVDHRFVVVMGVSCVWVLAWLMALITAEMQLQEVKKRQKTMSVCFDLVVV